MRLSEDEKCIRWNSSGDSALGDHSEGSLSSMTGSRSAFSSSPCSPPRRVSRLTEQHIPPTVVLVSLRQIGDWAYSSLNEPMDEPVKPERRHDCTIRYRFVGRQAKCVLPTGEAADHAAIGRVRRGPFRGSCRGWPQSLDGDQPRAAGAHTAV